jgi:2-polyprenyl-3-methyl-5-hydroxy-6-metoxy-1,4-benzoquinol methylase
MNFDNIKIIELAEDSEKFEKIIIDCQNAAKLDLTLHQLLLSIYLESDRDLAFNRFLGTSELKTILKIFKIFKLESHIKLCEIGGGPGFLAWALSKSGYCQTDLVEPNSLYNTGTGYLSSREDSNFINIYNELEEWLSDVKKYDVVVTKNCIHHFQNISLMASLIRKKMKPGAFWFSFREWFADTAEELYALLAQHPFCQKFDLYEWPYPSHHYVDAIEIAGFKLEAVIPLGYANNCLSTYSEEISPPQNEIFTNEIDIKLTQNPVETVNSFWSEIKVNKFYNGNLRFYSRPQMLLFRKTYE